MSDVPGFYQRTIDVEPLSGESLFSNPHPHPLALPIWEKTRLEERERCLAILRGIRSILGTTGGQWIEQAIREIENP